MSEQPTQDDKTIVKDYLALCVKNYGKHPTDYQKGIILGLECALGFIKSASSPQPEALPPTTCSPSYESMKTTEQIILQFATEQWGEKDLSGIALKLAEECGEIAGAIIKTDEGRSSYAELDKEVGDALIVLSQIAAKRGTTLEALRSQRFNHIQERVSQPSLAERLAMASTQS